MPTSTDARKIHDRLKHPVIDADGHWAEFAPHMREEFRKIGGDAAVEALALASARIPNSLNMSVAERRRRRIGQEAFWFLPTRNTLDRATAMLPRLMYERLDDLVSIGVRAQDDRHCSLLLDAPRCRGAPRTAGPQPRDDLRRAHPRDVAR